MKKVFFILMCVCVMPLVKADLKITNGTFDGGTQGGTNVPDWYDLNTNTNGTTDWWNTASVCQTGVNPFRDISGMACMLGDDYPSGNADRYIYQQIGTKASCQNYSISLDYGQPTDGSTARSVSIKVDIYQGNFPGAADDVDIAGKGLTLIDSVSSPTVSDVGLGVVHNFKSPLDLSSANSSGMLWIRIADLPGKGTNAGAFVVIDNVQITSEQAPCGSAFDPNPADKDTDTLHDVVLSWKPGESALTHNVYFGTDFNDVNNATVASHNEVTFTEGLDVNNLAVGTLDFSKTYYWRVDEVNAPSSPGTKKGFIWRFTVEAMALKLPKEYITVAVRNSSAKNDPNNTINEVGLDPNHMDQHSNNIGMWLSGTVSAADPVWIRYDFDKPYKIHEMFVWNYNNKMLINSGFRQVLIEYSADGSSWTPVTSVAEFAKATGNSGYVYNTVVPFNDVAAKSVRITALSNWGTSYKNGGLSEIRFTYIPTRATKPSPDTDSINVPIDTKLSWRPGRDVATHDVYISTDEQAVINGTAPVSTVAPANIGPMSLEFNRVYYWRVDEVNNAQTPSRWVSDIWNFYSVEYVSVDDFEDYNGNDGYYIWQTWDDGASKPANGGSQIGHINNPFVETTIVQHGKQSAPLYYDNTIASISEVSAQSLALPIGTTNWTKGNPDTLVIWFRGDPNNPATDQLYMKLNNANKKVYDGDAAGILRSAWTKWEIPLTGINLNNISSIAIGIERTGAIGGKGKIYLDNIQLTISVKPVDPGTSNLVAKYDMENNVQDSSGNGLNGTAIGAVNGPPTTYQAGKHGNALVFDGNDDYVALPIGQTVSTLTSCTVSAWVNWSGGVSWQRIFDFGSGTTDNMWLSPRVNSTTMRFAIKAGNSAEDQVNASPRLSANNWEHLAVVIDGENSTIKLYLNGEIIATNTNLHILPKNMGVTTQNWLGRSQYTADPYFKGILDDFRIYNKALSESEIRYLYKN